MKIIKEGSVSFRGGDVILDGWHVEGGTSQELLQYALSRVPWFMRFCVPWSYITH